jgi:plastocyanin
MAFSPKAPTLPVRTAGALLAAALLIGAPALAEDSGEAVTQIKQSFDPGTLAIAAGESVDFINADDVNHSLKLVPPTGDTVDFGVDKPGDTTRIAFAAPGQYTVICAIHPKMKLHVTVR